MPHLLLFRAMLGGAGLAGCVGLLAGQARADIVEFVPVRSAPEAVVTVKAPPVAATQPEMVLSVKVAPCSTDRRAEEPPRGLRWPPGRDGAVEGPRPGLRMSAAGL